MNRVAYLVHNLNDAAVARRVLMLRAGGAEVAIAGFWRGSAAPVAVAGVAAHDLGATHDARLLHRAASVARRALLPGELRHVVAGADAIVARNLEALAVAARVRPDGARLIYECLDIHRSLLGRSLAHRGVQRLELALLARIDGLIVSSPAFLSEYFDARLPRPVPTLLAENKVLALDGLATAAMPRPDGPPWRIGWFGNLRCRRSFAILSALAERSDGQVEVLIAGRPSPAEFGDFEAAVSRAPGCRFVGPYTADDLPELYAQCHFAWAIDYFEEGLNSKWLLPNRLYEAAAYGAVPIALAEVETGRRLTSWDAGLVLNDPSVLGELLGALDVAEYAQMVAAVAQLPRGALVADRGDCAALVDMVVGR